MPILTIPAIFTAHSPIVDQIMVSKDKAYILELKKKIVQGVLESKDGVILLKVGDCDVHGKSVNCRLSQQGLNKLRDEVGKLGIATTIIKGDTPDFDTDRCPVYIFASNAPAH
jgi:hypothetical protein